MLSEILFDMVEEIERYQRIYPHISAYIRIYPHIYNRVERDIEDLKARIRALQCKLNPPMPATVPEGW